MRFVIMVALSYKQSMNYLFDIMQIRGRSELMIQYILANILTSITTFGAARVQQTISVFYCVLTDGFVFLFLIYF